MTQIGSPTETFSCPLAEHSGKEWDYRIALNLKPAFNITKAVLPFILEANHGPVVNVSSVINPVASILAKRHTVRQSRHGWDDAQSRPRSCRQRSYCECRCAWRIETASSTEREIIAGKKHSNE